MTESSFASVDFKEVLERLVLYTQSLSAAFLCLGLEEKIEKVVTGGESAEDLAMTALLRFLDPLDPTVAWSENRGEPTTLKVLAYLRKVVERDFLDLKRSKRYKTTVYLSVREGEDSEEETTVTLDQVAKDFENPERQVINHQRVQWVLKKFDGDPELKEILELQLDPAGYSAFSNQELAVLLNTTVGDIENRKKRIKLRLRKLAASHGTEEAEYV